MKEDNSISKIEKIENIVYDTRNSEQSSLSLWYSSIRNMKISNLSSGDLARLIRQRMYIKYIIKECINRLYKNPFTGEKYDGELIYVLSNNIDSSFWKENLECKDYVSDYIRYFKSKDLLKDYEEVDDFEKDEIIKYINNLSVNVDLIE